MKPLTKVGGFLRFGRKTIGMDGTRNAAGWGHPALREHERIIICKTEKPLYKPCARCYALHSGGARPRSEEEYYMKEHYKGLGHVAIYTADMEQSIAFYEKIGGSVYKRDGVQTPAGEKKLALVEFGGFLLELIEPPVGSLVPSGEGSIPHFAVYVDDLDKTAADLKAAGIISFTEPEKKVLPNTFGGLQNWFFTGPSGEQIELLQML